MRLPEASGTATPSPWPSIGDAFPAVPGLYWVPRTGFGQMGGSGGGHAGIACSEWSEMGGEPEFSVYSISTVAFQDDGRGNPVPAGTQYVVSVSAHEMGHALGSPIPIAPPTS